jgi:DNA-binding MarR family transcriptional regulator
MPEADVLEALAEAAEAAAAVFRRRAALARPQPQGEQNPGTALDLARQIHPMLGQRQAEVVGELEKAGASGTTTSAIAAALQYDQANTHIALSALVKYGIAEKDTSAYPHVYRLTTSLLTQGHH